MTERIKCVCCTRQLVSHDLSGKDFVTAKGAVRMTGKQFCCFECAVELDENGLFPEER